ncbi:hypothetical protein OAL44_00635 [Planctomycetaceae bacterium]|nr:hypothetical protein [Planctomycetaceae bacterium]
MIMATAAITHDRFIGPQAKRLRGRLSDLQKRSRELDKMLIENSTASGPESYALTTARDVRANEVRCLRREVSASITLAGRAGLDDVRSQLEGMLGDLNEIR